MKQKLALLRKYSAKAAVGVSAMTGSVVAFAAATPIPTTEPIAQIGEGSTAAVAIGLAMLGFVILVGVLLKTRRAGS